MLKRIALLCLALLLMLPCAFAEDAPGENPFVGAWEVLYYIQDGKPLTREAAGENPVMFVFTEDTLELHFDDGSVNQVRYSAEGNTCVIGSVIYTLEHDDLIVGHATSTAISLSFLLTRIDPLVLNNPFIGTWNVLCGIDGSELQTYPGTLSISFEAQQALIFTDGVQNAVYSCSYGDNQCRIEWDGTLIIAAIGEDGLLTLTNSEDATQQIICAPEDEEVPEEISQFYGAWREIASLANGILTTDQIPFSMRSDGSSTLCQFEFSRATVVLAFPEIENLMPTRLQCTYSDGTCTILYNDGPVLCTVDVNGLMCIRAKDGSWTSWLVRVEEENAEDPLAAE